MALDFLRDTEFVGPAFSEPFVRFEPEKELSRLTLLPKSTGAEGCALEASWEVYRRHLRELVLHGGPVRVFNQVIAPLKERLGYERIESSGTVETREGSEPGGDLLLRGDGSSKLRVWCTSLEEDLDAPARCGAAYRYSHVRVAQRVLLACGETARAAHQRH